MKRLLFLIIILSSVVIVKYSTAGININYLSLNTVRLNDTASCHYYPLDIGNIFYFQKIYSLNNDTSYFTTRITDTVIHNNKKYFHVINFMYGNSTYDVRYDSTNGELKRYCDTAAGCNYELKLFKLAALPYDTMGVNYCVDWRPLYPYGTVSFYCDGYGTISIFNETVNYKSFYASSQVTQFVEYTRTTLAKDFGIIKIVYLWGSHLSSYTYTYNLKGAKIKGITYGDTNLIGIKQISAEVPLNFSMEQNYPNPFNPVTKIKFDISKSSNVILKIFDVLGSEVETLVNSKQSPGTYEVKWNASGNSSGIYFYKIQTENFTKVMKMILIR